MCDLDEVLKALQGYETDPLRALQGYETDPLKVHAARTILAAEMTKRLSVFLAACKQAGYTKIVIGLNEKVWIRGPYNSVYAYPSDPSGTRPHLWDLTKHLGGHGCGNGFKGCVQAQLNIYGPAIDLIAGEYNL